MSQFANYSLPVISLDKETPKEAVCTVFEKAHNPKLRGKHGRCHPFDVRVGHSVIRRSGRGILSEGGLDSVGDGITFTAPTGHCRASEETNFFRPSLC